MDICFFLWNATKKWNISPVVEIPTMQRIEYDYPFTYNMPTKEDYADQLFELTDDLLAEYIEPTAPFVEPYKTREFKGRITTYDEDGRYQSYGDRPAISSAGVKIWAKNGMWARDNGKPSIVILFKDGHEFMAALPESVGSYLCLAAWTNENGELDRSDGPAVVLQIAGSVDRDAIHSQFTMDDGIMRIFEHETKFYTKVIWYARDKVTRLDAPAIITPYYIRYMCNGIQDYHQVLPIFVAFDTAVAWFRNVDQRYVIICKDGSTYGVEGYDDMQDAYQMALMHIFPLTYLAMHRTRSH